MFTNSRNNIINGGTFNVHGTGGNSYSQGFQLLQDTVATNAFHNSDVDSFDKPKCHPGTRIAVIERIMAWVCKFNDPENSGDQTGDSIMWMHGKAGAGKSAIAQSIAEECEAACLLLATFFFARSDATRNHARALIPTIAYQITKVLPQLRPHLDDAIHSDPLILKCSIEAQMRALIVAPLQELSAAGYFRYSASKPSRRLIIIDGLDECNDHVVQGMILNSIANSLRRHRLPLIFLIASRPEVQITNVFNSFNLGALHIQLELNHTFNPDDDIRLFLKESFNEIKDTHWRKSSLPIGWPPGSALDALVRKASGQFIYASVVKKYVQSPRHNPATRLDTVLGLRPVFGNVNPFIELDALYIHILQDLEDIEIAMILLANLCVTSRDNMGVDSTSYFLDVPVEAIEICVADLSSLVNITEDGYLSLSHASFSDFLHDQSRSGQFHIDRPTACAAMVRSCIKHISSEAHLSERFGNVIMYSAHDFNYYLHQAEMAEELRHLLCNFPIKYENICHIGLLIAIHEFKDFIRWLGDQMFEGGRSACTRHLSELNQSLRKELQKYYAHSNTTLLVAVLIYLCNPPNSSKRLCRNEGSMIVQLDATLRQVDVCWTLEELSFNQYIGSLVGGKDFIQFLEDTELSGLDRQIYSTAALACLQYLCNHRKHMSTFTKEIRSRRLDMRKEKACTWHRMRRAGDILKRVRKCRRSHFEEERHKFQHSALQIKYQFSDSNFCIHHRYHTDALDKYHNSHTYSAALELQLFLIQRSIGTPGDFNPEFITYARRCTFGITSFKFPRLTRAAKKAIARILAEARSATNIHSELDI